MEQRPAHIPVLIERVLELLAPRAGETYVDCTAGLGGHAAAVAERVGATGTVVLNDADPGNLAKAVKAVAAAVVGGQGVGPRVIAVQGNFANVPRQMVERGIAADMVLADLGFSSNQVDEAARGFSFSRDGPLDMRLDPTLPVTAADLVASLPEAELVRIIRDYGEDRDAPRIARKLVEARRGGPISTTGQLAQIIRSASGRRPSRDSIDPATRTFQALRIAVNDELGSLESLLEQVRRGAEKAGLGGAWLRPGARFGIIAFHSLEDRPVKRAFAEMAASGVATVLTKRPVEADEAEVDRNPRARSARLRVVRVAGGAA